ncbi:ATP-binding protein [Microbulbifer sp. ZKSA006]|uniref:ATP-binding protein n=1 Tax=Microbulbifer sp. ZKSA006 TaxID=3243390 RepID=UPI0040396E08
MKRAIFFVAGIHGVGKSTLCKKISKLHSLPHYSASELIQRIRSGTYSSKKVSQNVGKNQNFLITAINELVSEQTIILDGHFCLFNKDEEIERIPTQTFMDLSPCAVILMHDEISSVMRRIENRDNTKHSTERFAALQSEEILYGKKITEKLNIPLLIFNFNDDESEIHNLINTIK